MLPAWLASLLRFGRVIIAQLIAFAITSTMNINIPYVNISLGAVISGIAKYLRDKYKWEWLPV